MILCRKVYQFGLFFCCFTLTATLTIAQTGMPGSSPVPDKKKSAKEIRDPSLSRSSPIAKFDEKTKAALLRANQSGVLLSGSSKKDHIYRIEIIGAKKIEADAVLLQLKTQIGDKLDQSLIRQDVKRIYNLGLFSDVVVEKKIDQSGGILLYYNLKEKPEVHEIKISGNQAISTEDLLEIIDLKNYQVADQARIAANIDKIKNAYNEKGYFLSGVQVETVTTVKSNKVQDDKAPALVDVIFTVDEGSKVRIQDISFIGNDTLSTDKIKMIMRSKEDHPLGIITKWGTFNEEMFDVDLLLIEQLYQDNGFLNVQVQKPRIDLSEDKSQLFIKIPIVEKDQYSIGNVKFSGDFIVDKESDFSNEEATDSVPVFFKEDLRENISLQNGDIFNRSQLMREVMSIAELYRNEGYAYVNIIPQTAVDDAGHLVDVDLQVEAGPKVFYEKIEIAGNSKTMDEVIRRELRIFEGEQTSSSLMRLSEMRVKQMGYFETVQFQVKPGSKPNQLIVIIEVKEKRTGSMSAGLGYGTAGEGLVLQGQVSQNNLFGRGQSLTGTIQWSGMRRIFDLRFADPYLFYVGMAPVTFSFSLFNARRNVGVYSRGSTGGDITFGYPIGIIFKETTYQILKNASLQAEPYVPDFENLRLFLTYNVERIEASDNALQLSLLGLHDNQARYTTALKPVLQFDQRNNRMAPTAGYFFEFRFEWASAYLGSGLLSNTEQSVTDYMKKSGLKGGLDDFKPDSAANRFLRYSANARAYYNFDSWFVLKDWVIKFNFDIGVLDTFGKLIVSENYQLGGMGFGNQAGLRGYYFQSVGPVLEVPKKYINQPSYDLVVGGNKQVLVNLELEFPIIKNLNISGVFFFDMGNVFDFNQQFFYLGEKTSPNAQDYFDPLRIYSSLGLFASVGMGVRWFSPFGPLRFEWGFPLVRRPKGTPGMPYGDGVVQFEFNIGTSF